MTHPPTRQKGKEASKNLAASLHDKFNATRTARRTIEQRWLDDLRQYKGKYAPNVLQRLHPKRSKAFVRLTRSKVRTADARLMDLLFPGNGQSNWSIDPTPIPELAPARQGEIITDLTERLGHAPKSAEIDSACQELAEDACAAMTNLMRDQLAESRYREVIRDVIHSGNLYGTGILKGPMVERRIARQWTETSRGWHLTSRPVLRPYLEFVPVWDVFPDMEAREPARARFIFQRHVMSRYDLERLADRTDFDEQAIRDHLRDHPQGNCTPSSYERDLASMGDTPERHDATRSTDDAQRHELIEFWGFVPGRDLAACGAQVDEALYDEDVPATIWLAENRIIKAAASPLTGVRWPYYFYYFDKDETSIFGEGLASIMHDAQQLFNASIRALLDNAAIAAGPQIEVNQDLLPAGEDPSDLYPFRVWLRSGPGAESQSPALRVFTLPATPRNSWAWPACSRNAPTKSRAFPALWLPSWTRPPTAPSAACPCSCPRPRSRSRTR
ncbi:MAG: hypothetical protein ACNI3A_12090 [Desulfovibrio sp.]|uniref:hypothetical protein n=1 Tax=Desulfovibrio sp. 7SRBS1 TaxID=3378064 RepID=UPI003B3CBAE2